MLARKLSTESEQQIAFQKSVMTLPNCTLYLNLNNIPTESYQKASLPAYFISNVFCIDFETSFLSFM